MLRKLHKILHEILPWVFGAFVLYIWFKVIFWLDINFASQEESYFYPGLIISTMIAWRVEMAIFCKDINGRVSSVNNINYFVWLAGLSIYIALTFLTDMAFSRQFLHLRYSHNFILFLIETFLFIAKVGGILWLMAQWRRNALERVENERNAHEQLKKECTAYKYELEWLKNERTASNIKPVVKKVKAAKKPKIPDSSAPAYVPPVRPATTWPFPTPEISKPDKPE